VLEENPESLRDADLGDRLDRAFEAMFMAFQPIVMPRDQKIYGYEALMRTREPSMPNPGLILEAAERLGRVHELGARVRSLSAEAFRSAPDDAFLFVNLHTSDLLDDALFDPEGPLAKIATRVILEVTERATLAHMHDVAGRTKHLRELGFRLAVDDLGAGYAGLSSFAMLEPELTKLDMSLVRGIDKSPVRQRVVASMTTLCKQLGVELVAEGVETREERDALDALGCTLMQGYHFARPAPPFATVAW
jgi:EAL domain-containing protein (putative c-di-GMP-specific phosphodiesterase class I)